MACKDTVVVIRMFDYKIKMKQAVHFIVKVIMAIYFWVSG